jgi:ElaB/YqjD/DUF883 family membrane-anchored ribosome-binding protein
LVKPDNDLDAAQESLKNARRDIGKRIDKIKADLKEKGPEAIEAVEESLDALKEDLDGRLDDTREGIEDQLEMSRDEIKKHPLMAVGVAVLAGIIVGMLFSDKGKN